MTKVQGGMPCIFIAFLPPQGTPICPDVIKPGSGPNDKNIPKKSCFGGWKPVF
jgi:hypothetical protein